MAESQLICMEDGNINLKIPETKPEFYYSEEQRAALEQLLKNGDGAFKSQLKDDKFTDFLSAREIKVIRNTLITYKTDEQDEENAQNARTVQKHADDSSSLRSTYWPQMSDTEIPPLDVGWPSGGFFKGVTRVAVYTHPPKDNGPHIKEVVRRLIQGAGKVIAIVMDLLTDVQILRDLLDAASIHGVPVYIVLDVQGVPHFLDMCNRLGVSSRLLENIRVRTVRGVGFDMHFGRIPGSLCSKYMLIDGDKVAFGSYSYSWTTSRMDRNMITVLSGQIVDTFDRDFRELYAVSDKLDLFKEFNVSRPSTGTLTRVTVPKRPTTSTTSRFQVSLGEMGELKVPAHKYHNPKYLLALGEVDKIAASKDFIGKMEPGVPPEEMVTEGAQTQGGGENPDQLSELPDQTLNKSNKKMKFFKMKQLTLERRTLKTKDSAKDALEVDAQGSPALSTAGNPALTNHMVEPTRGLEKVSTLSGHERLDQENTLPDPTQNKGNKFIRFFKKKSYTQERNTLQKTGASKEALEADGQGSSAPSTAGNPALTNHMVEPTRGPEKVSTLGGHERLDQENTLPDPTQNKGNKFIRCFKKKSYNLKNTGASKEALEADGQGSPAPSTAGNPKLTTVTTKPTQGPEEPPDKETTPAKAKIKNQNENKSSVQQSINSQEDKGVKDQEHNQKTCILS